MFILERFLGLLSVPFLVVSLGVRVCVLFSCIIIHTFPLLSSDGNLLPVSSVEGTGSQSQLQPCVQVLVSPTTMEVEQTSPLVTPSGSQPSLPQGPPVGPDVNPRTIQGDTKSHHSDPVLETYSSSDSGPFLVHVMHTDLNVAMLHPLKLGKIFYDSQEFVIQEVKKINKNKVEIHFPTGESANKFLLSDRLVQHQLRGYIPRYRLQCVGVVRNVAVGISDEEIKAALNASNSIPVTQVYRFNRRVVNADAGVEWVPTTTVKMTFRAQYLPTHVYLFFNRLQVDKYNLPILQCKNCFKFGHREKFCRSPIRCRLCGEGHSHTECKQGDTPKCSNCSLNHTATDAQCPVFKTQQTIRDRMVEHNIPYQQAYDVVRGKYSLAHVVRLRGSAKPPVPTTTDFPPLTSRTTSREVESSASPIFRPSATKRPRRVQPPVSQALHTTLQYSKELIYPHGRQQPQVPTVQSHPVTPGTPLLPVAANTPRPSRNSNSQFHRPSSTVQQTQQACQTHISKQFEVLMHRLPPEFKADVLSLRDDVLPFITLQTPGARTP